MQWIVDGTAMCERWFFFHDLRPTLIAQPHQFETLREEIHDESIEPMFIDNRNQNIDHSKFDIGENVCEVYQSI